jgi:hypothetical protein
MKKRWLIVVAGVTACASTDAVLGGYPPPEDQPIVSTDAGPTDAAPPEAEAAAAPCDDCEYFPDTCTDDALCSNGPFAATTPGGALDLRAQITAIRGRSASDVWLVGTIGSLAHFDGTSWKRSDAESKESILGLWLRDGSEIATGVFASDGRPWIYSRGGTPPEGSEPPSPDGWTSSAPSVPDTYEKNVRNASAWSAPGAEWLWLAMGTHNYQDTSTSGLVRLRQGPSTVFEIAPGPASSCLPGCNQMNGVHGASANDVWAVGAGGTTIRVTDAESDTPSATLYDSRTLNTLHAVWAASASDVWSVGAGGTVRRYTGQGLRWDVVPNVPTSVDLHAIGGSSSSDVWVVGDAGVVLHYDGKSWSRVKVAGIGARRPNLTAVWCSAPGRVWVGGQGVMLSLGGKP